MVDSNNTVECRYIADRDEWQGWQMPSDKGNSRAQLRRMIGEWQEQKQILSDLATIHPDINRALATVLQAHELMSRATITVSVETTQVSETVKEVIEEKTDFEFEESVEC